ncbi:MAG TPA: hypothetical protein ENN61_01975 [Bacteroidaceae bacterium]|nr:hypothetical protein [Bacteroidaceae bacterium]
MNIPADIEKIFHDTDSGSVLLVNKLLFAFEKLLQDPSLDDQLFRHHVLTVRKEMRHFAAVENLCGEMLVRLDEPYAFPSVVSRYLTDYRTYWEHSAERITENLTRRYELASKTILTHSNSETILSVFKILKQQGIPFRVLQTCSSPGNEGVISKRKIKDLDIKVLLIDDEDAVDVFHETDLVLMGCDTLLKEEFLNKKGTMHIAKLARKYKKPFVLLTESRKQIVVDNWKEQLNKNPFFEWVPLHLVTGVITEKDLP